MELGPEDRDVVTKLAALLRIADGLDRSHAGAVRDLSVRGKTGRLVCRLRPRHNAWVGLEIWGAERKKQLFEETFKLKVSFVCGG